jgi:hypothetical protein
MLRSVVLLLSTLLCYINRNDQWGESCCQGELQKCSPLIVPGGEVNDYAWCPGLILFRVEGREGISRAVPFFGEALAVPASGPP